MGFLLEKYKIEQESMWVYGNSPYLIYLPDEAKLKEVVLFFKLKLF